MQISDIPKLRERVLAEVLSAYGHIDGLDDVDRLCLALSNVEHHKHERLEALNCNARQAAQIAILQRGTEQAA